MLNRSFYTVNFNNVCLLLLFLATGFAVFFPGLFGPFLLDDLQTIAPTRLDHFTWQSFWRITFENETGPIGRPLAIASFALNHLLVGHDAFHFKLVNLVLHAINALLIITLLNHLARLNHRLPGSEKFAFIIAFIWFIHPLQVSTALYPVQRMVLLCTLFTLSSLILYVQAVIFAQTNQRHAKICLGLCYGVCFPLAVLSKETGVLIPFYLLAIDLILKPNALNQTSFIRTFQRLNYALVIMTLLGALVYFYIKLDIFLATFAEKGYSIYARLLTEIHALIFYLKQSFLPQVSKMGLYHDDFSIIFSPTLITFSYLGILIAMVTGIFIFRRTLPLVSFGLAWFFISHLIESTVLPLEPVFEHRNYLALLGLILIATTLFMRAYQYIDSKFTQSFLRIFAVLLIFGFTSLCFARSFTWSSAERFLNKAFIHHPNSARVHIEMANWLLSSRSYFFALMELDRAESLQPYNAGISLHKLLIYCHGESAPEALYQEVESKITKTELNPYTIMILDAIVNNLMHQQCNGIKLERIENIVTTFYQHPYLKYKPVYHAMLLHLEAGLKLIKGNQKQSRTLLMQSFQVYPKRYQPLQEKVNLEKGLGLDDDLQESLKLLQQYHPNVADKLRPKQLTE